MAGADFAQVYTSALALRYGESAYNPKTAEFRDRFQRPSGYPPLMNWLYLPLAFLSYEQALLVHTAFSLALLFGVSVLVLYQAKLARYAALVVAAQAALLLLTPIGATHLERGQFDLLVAAGAAVCFACSYAPKRALPALSLFAGFLAALKWTSGAFLGCFSALGFLTSSGLRRWAFFAIPPLALLGTLVFWNAVGEYWLTIQVYELEASPFGLTLQHFLPRMATKLTPVAITLAVIAAIWLKGRTPWERSHLLGVAGAPFALALTNVGICFGTLSYEYHTVTTLGMLPGLAVWIARAPVAYRVKWWTAAAYATFLAVAFRTLDPVLTLTPAQMSGVYVLFAGGFLAVSLFLVCIRPLEANLEPVTP